ncbi:MAG TPA: 3-hydroxybutyryl-CoA dehydrogenase [Candidatus Thermoplasmatota archaeon]|nr:3-hydroxybutyryl-CoA dehydrogenase [Candidatus Thermoplasmatota archaeon]
MQIQKIAVIGAGQMGSGIAQVAAQAGYTVVLRDIKDEFVQKGVSGIDKSLSKFVEKGKLTADQKTQIMGRITGTTDLKACADVDLVVEAIIENADLKKKLFQDLDAIVKPSAIFASNTSSIPITEMAAATKRARQFIGMHFMNPVPLMQLVEVIRGHDTSPETAQAVLDAARKMGKTPVECNDYPGFVSNRVLLPMLNEAMFAVHEGVATPEAVDAIMKMGMNHPMGPLQLADFIGLDTCLAIMNVLYEGFKDSKYRPCPLLVKKVQAGHLGRKVGKGFYKYDDKGNIAGMA